MNAEPIFKPVVKYFLRGEKCESNLKKEGWRAFLSLPRCEVRVQILVVE